MRTSTLMMFEDADLGQPGPDSASGWEGAAHEQTERRLLAANDIV